MPGLQKLRTHHFVIFGLLVIVLALLLADRLPQSPVKIEEGGTSGVQFLNSCGAAVQVAFGDAITNLHSFEYPEATRLFTEVVDRDPGCAMAYWGLAMTLWQPLWAPPGAAELERGATALASTDSLEKTPREAAYIDALKVFFSMTDAATHAQRAQAYEVAMGTVYAKHLDDPEAAVFYALALLASTDPHDKSYARQFKAAGLLNWVGKSQPTHPGVLHYLIHAYDYPGLAHLALEEAMLYARTAPDSAHAQHMPSHIFTRLGLWNLSLASNRDSTQSAAAYTLHAHLPGHYDEGLHSIDYLMYALLQTAQFEQAEALLKQLADIRQTDTENFKVAYTYAATPARYALERHAWREASELELMRPDFPWQDFTWAQSIHHFTRGIGAARSGQLAQAQQELLTIESIQQALSPAVIPYWREQVQVHIDALTAWIRLAEGDENQALASAALAADREDSVDKHPVTPGEVLPARELYADLLLETGHHESALEQYRIVLTHSPNRLNALLGAAAAATAIGDEELAGFYASAARSQARAGK